MPKRKYKDDEKERKYRNKQRHINYSATALYVRSRYTEEDDKLILAHEIPDRQLSEIIRHSVQSIQIRRSRLKGGIVK